MHVALLPKARLPPSDSELTAFSELASFTVSVDDDTGRQCLVLVEFGVKALQQLIDAICKHFLVEIMVVSHHDLYPVIG